MIHRKFNYLLIGSLFLSIMVSCTKEDEESGANAFTEIKYTQSHDIFPNPERGFMHIYTVASEGEPLDRVHLRALKQENVTLIHRFYYFEAFKDKPLSVAQLDLIKGDMERVREAGIKCILRFGYTGLDYVYEVDKGTDAPYDIVEQHLDQLQPVFEENQDVIAFVHAGFIGPWGEWHNSSNNLTTPYYMTKVLEKLLSVLPEHIMVQVRTPRYKQEIFGTANPVDKSIAYTADYRARTGHHNDCFMTGGTDYGTYTNIEADKAYIGVEGLFVPNGGETCPPTEGTPSCTEAKETMRMLRWTYLNLDWYKPTIDAWKASGCFNEFQRDLGYRLSLVDASLPKEVQKSRDLIVNINITNKGYAPLYNFKKTSLILKNESSGERYALPLAVDMRNCKPNGILNINDSLQISNVPEGVYDLYLKIADRSESLKDRSEYSIRLANQNVWTTEEGINNLMHKVRIKN